MKNSILLPLLIIIALSCCHFAKAQSFKNYYQNKSESFQSRFQGLEMNVRTSRSIRGWSNGWGVNMNFSNGLKIGYFQLLGRTKKEQVKRNERGIELAFLLNRKGRVSIGPSLKFSTNNKNFISMVPMLESRIGLLKNVYLQVSSGYSEKYPIFIGGLNFKL